MPSCELAREATNALDLMHMAYAIARLDALHAEIEAA
jgi:hypothetical protein